MYTTGIKKEFYESDFFQMEKVFDFFDFRF